MSTSKEFCHRLDSVMRERGLLRKDIAPLADLSPQAISHWFLHGKMPHAKTVERLAANLGISVKWLIEGEGPKLAPVALEKVGAFPSASAEGGVLIDLCAKLDAPTLPKLSAGLVGKNQHMIAVAMLRALADMAERNPDFRDDFPITMASANLVIPRERRGDGRVA